MHCKHITHGASPQPCLCLSHSHYLLIALILGQVSICLALTQVLWAGGGGAHSEAISAKHTLRH